ncbi:MAG: hypothetical protein KDD42_07970 [Bdellovibrionales bacterium]|nr:hypothetical protein [Bdellovibrionales bacterium]
MNKAAPEEISFSNQSYSSESWKEAGRIASLIGTVPSNFTSCIHFLRKDYEDGASKLSPAANFTFGRLLKSDRFKAPLYYGAKTFFPETLQSEKYLTPQAYARLYGMDTLLVAISVLFLFKHIQRGCDEEEWERLEKSILTESEIGAFLGCAIPNIGTAVGLMVGGMRGLGLAMLMGIDKKGFKDYRRNCAKNRSTYEMQEELSRWGCNHVQIGSLMLQYMGLGVGLVDSYVAGFNPEIRTLEKLQPEPLKVKLASIWIEALRDTGKAPEMTHIGKFYPLKDALTKLEERCEHIRNTGTYYSWLKTNGNDISAEKTPHLFGKMNFKDLTNSANAKEELELIDEDLSPEDLQEIASEEFE